MRRLDWEADQMLHVYFDTTIPSLTTRAGFLRTFVLQPDAHLRLVLALQIFISCKLRLCL